MNKIEANKVIDDLSDNQIDMLRRARLGFSHEGADKRTYDNLFDRGLVRLANFENARASNAIEGVLTTEDGEKVLQELDNRPAVETQHTVVTENGNEIEATEVKVNDPVPAKNNPRKSVEKGEAKGGELDQSIGADKK